MIATDKILSAKDFSRNLGLARHSNYEDGIEPSNRLEDSYSQLTALCREQQKALIIIQDNDYVEFPYVPELIAAFPESLKEKNEA